MLLGSGGGRFVRLSSCCRLLSVPLGEQASGRKWDFSGIGHVARKYFGTKWYSDVPGHGLPEMVTPAVVLFVF